ncbi:universal stress protein [Microvirga alba]|uniref:Universal stress protein n=1 Tax=Microvirga alba TaxID=2791025 RepID=A0A931FNS7_9HYPH|nr:universal stress protein [Microvirga alba]MBF9232657.1 universal stress protein [Microvirga alba]
MIKDVLVHLDGTPEDEERLQFSEMIASTSQAHITGLFTNPLPDYAGMVSMDGGAAAAGVLAALEDEARRQGDLVEQRLAERFSRLAVPNEIRRVDETRGMLTDTVARETRWTDLFVMSRPYRENHAARWDDLFEAALFESGRGVVVVPPKWRSTDSIRRVLVCWRDSREASHALAEALPLIEGAVRTAILVVDPEQDETGQRIDPVADIARYLDHHGTQVEANIVESDGRGVSDVILDQARRLSADLIVMGGYGHSRAREWIIGGATQEMLGTSEFPILMAH